jgi:hypothetical protein
LKPNSIYEVELDYDFLDDDDDSSDIDVWVHGRIVKASLQGPVNRFQGIKEYQEMLCGPSDESDDDSEESRGCILIRRKRKRKPEVGRGSKRDRYPTPTKMPKKRKQ